MIEKVLSKLNNIKQVKKLLNSLSYKKELNGKKIVFFTIRSYSLILHQELFLAYQLAELGAKVDIILDDGLYEHWDMIQEHDHSKDFTLYKSSLKYKLITKPLAVLILDAHKHKNINIVLISELLKDTNLDKIETLSILEKQQAESSVRRYFENGSMDLTIEKHQNYYNKSLINCLVSKSTAKEIQKQLKPDLFITSHGIYSVWGPAFNYMKNEQIPSIVYGAHAYKSQEIIICDVIAQVLSQDSDWKKFEKNYVLTTQEVNKVEKYFDSRIDFTASDTKVYYGDIQSFDSINIKKSNDIKTFALFPNIIWDGDVYERDTIFKGIIDWVEKTVNIFKTSKHNLVIRFHPAEATLWKDSKSLEPIIRDLISDIEQYKNIFLVSSNKKLHTYNFILDNIDIGLIYDGVLAMEMPYIKKPVISCAMSRYTGAGFVYEPKSLDEYEDILNNPLKLIENFENTYVDKKEKLLKYAYWYFYICGYHLPIFDKDKILTINTEVLNKYDVDITVNSKLNRTIKKLISHIK